MLQSNDIDLLVDVRGKWPFSRHNPQHNRENISIWLPTRFGIEYIHMPLLGGWQPKQKVDPSINGGWRVQGMKNYADYTRSDEFMEGLLQLEAEASKHKLAYMCAEAVPWRCHRLLLSNVLVARGHKVIHIMNRYKTVEHELGMWGAVPAKDNCTSGIVTYPKQEA